VKTARALRDRKTQRALLQFWKPENWFSVREALVETGRAELIGDGPGCLIPPNPPREALEARRRNADRAAPGDAKAKTPRAGAGYRPGRATARRRSRH
jgi:hypothetical protein